MTNARRSIALLAFGLSACAGNAYMLGQTAALPLPGAAEMSLSGGALYGQESSPVIGGGTTSGSTLALPVLEGNLEYGLSPRFALETHASAAGVEPGVKIALLEGDTKLTLLPQMALGFAYNGNNGVTFNGHILSFVAGLELILSTAHGLYAGAGVAYHYVSQTDTFAMMQTSVGTSQNELDIHVGEEKTWSNLIWRPELALFVVLSANESATGVTVPASTGWAIVPNVTFALRAGPAPAAPAAERAPAAREPAR